MTYLIGLNGRRGAGKDTAYSFIHSWGEERGVSVGRRGFADAMKLSFARIFMPDVSVDEAVIWCDILKNEGVISIEWGGNDKWLGQTSHVRHEMTGRLTLQRYGTEAHRNVFGDDFWVDVLLPLDALIATSPNAEEPTVYEPSWPRNFMGQFDQEPPQICVITDCRFENEAQRVHDLGGKVWEIHRGGQKIDDGHASEVPLPPTLIDLTIYNSYEDNLKLFEQDIREALEALEL